MDTATDNRAGASLRPANASGNGAPRGRDISPTAPAKAGRVAIVGLGYVGLPTALVLHEAGFTIQGIDVSKERLSAIADGEVDLLDIERRRLRAALADPDRFELSAKPYGIAKADTVIICVPTPVDSGRNPDLTALRSACEFVVDLARPGQTLILTSTSHVGATRELLIEPLARRGLRAGHEVALAFSPERIDPGNDAHRQDQVPRVLGGETARCAERAAAVLGRATPRLHVVSSPEAAELTKLHENAFRAVNIAYANEMAEMCRNLGLDPIEVVEAAATKPYGFLPFYPGPGVGGHCIPCDPHYLLASLRGESHAPLTAAAMEEIASRPRVMADRALKLLRRRGLEPRRARALVVGASYKPGVADVRESPGVAIIERLREAGVDAQFHDPRVDEISLGESGERLERVSDPGAGDWDLILIASADRNSDYEWLNGDVAVLDCTFRVAGQTPEPV